MGGPKEGLGVQRRVWGDLHAPDRDFALKSQLFRVFSSFPRGYPGEPRIRTANSRGKLPEVYRKRDLRRVFGGFGGSPGGLGGVPMGLGVIFSHFALKIIKFAVI